MAILKSSLTNTLKKQVKDLRQEVTDLRKERTDKKFTKMNEVTAELEIMQQECVRLRTLLEQTLKGHHPTHEKSDDQGVKETLIEKDEVIDQMRRDNIALAQACKDKDEEIEKHKVQASEIKSKYEKQK